jgi:ABC-type multidrug transport system ATPase subunit
MKNFSGGMKQRAGVAQFFLSTKPVVIVDEPTAGLDPLERVRFRLILSELARTRIVILSTHIVEDITSSCKCLAVLNKGEVVYHGDLDGVQRGAKGMIWDLVKPSGEDVPIPRRRILFRKHIGDNVMYHYVARDPLPGSVPVEATFEDAYVALLLKHNTDESGMPEPAV